MISKVTDKYEYVKRMDDGAREVQYKAIVFHTNGSKVPTDGDLYDWWMTGSDPGVGAHYQNTKSGWLFQYLPTDRYTGHAWDANHWTVAVEHEDDGDPTTPLTDAQIETDIALCKELGIPAQLLKEVRSNGVGWHEQYASWNKNSHACPGGVREDQIRNIIIPALALPVSLTGMSLPILSMKGA